MKKVLLKRKLKVIEYNKEEIKNIIKIINVK